jgi:DNA-binding Lrp family transcriptional regulator
MHKKVLEKLRGYQTFKTAKEVDAAIEAHLAEHMLNDSQLRTLRVLAYRAKQVPGVAYVKYETIAEIIGKTRRTVINAVKGLVEKGIIEKHGTVRETKGGCGANIFSILPFTSDFTSDCTTDDTSQEEVESSATTEPEAPFAGGEEVKEVEEVKENSLYTSYNVQDAREEQDKKEISIKEDEQLDKTFVSKMVPEEFSNLVGMYLKDALDIYKLYQRAILAANKLGAPVVRDDIAVEAFKQTLFTYKSRKLRGSFFGYFYSTYYAMHEQAIAQEIRRKAMGEMPVWMVAEEEHEEAVDYYDYL